MMRTLTLAEVANAIGREACSPDRLITGVGIDSRQIKSGDLFVALKGGKFDAHDFLAEVEKNGAVAAIVEKHRENILLPQLLVADSVKALGEVATLNRNFFSGKVIGLTGSAGKTTTKEMIASILLQVGNPLVTAGNLNNHIGVPLTLLRLAPENDSAVIEMGASAVGDISYLTAMVKPDVALVTNVAPAHLEGFGSIENVAKGKREIFEALAVGGHAIVNLDNEWTASWASDLASRFCAVTYSMKVPADIFATDIQQSAIGMSFMMHIDNQMLPVQLPFLGEHNVGNALAAAACCLSAGVSVEAIVSGLQVAKPYKGRLESKRGINGCLVIDDSYNANPSSVRMAIKALMSCGGDKVLVLGDMGELGSETRELHADIGLYAREAGVERLLVTGELSKVTAESFGAGALVFDNWELLADYCKKMATSDSVFLIKGSRSAAMDRVSNALVESGSSLC